MVKRIIKKCTKNGTPIFCKTYLTIRIHKVLQDYKDTHLLFSYTYCKIHHSNCALSMHFNAF